MTCSGNTSLSHRYRHAAELFGPFRCSPGVFCFGFIRRCAKTVLSVTFTWKNVEVSSEVWAVNNTAVNQKQPMKTRRSAIELIELRWAPRKRPGSVGSCWGTCASQPGTTSLIRQVSSVPGVTPLSCLSLLSPLCSAPRIPLGLAMTKGW